MSFYLSIFNDIFLIEGINVIVNWKTFLFPLICLNPLGGASTINGLQRVLTSISYSSAYQMPLLLTILTVALT